MISDFRIPKSEFRNPLPVLGVLSVKNPEPHRFKVNFKLVGSATSTP